MTRPIGIDLGTTNCCAAWIDGDAIHVLTDEANRVTMPSVLAETTDGKRLVGFGARNLESPPRFRHGFVKRHLGTDVSFPLGDGDHTAAEISAHYLRELKRRAESALGEEVAAVVTVPAHFEQIHLEETRVAARQAGLELIDLILEPVAAAVAWFHDEAPAGARASGKVLVYDLGGGTFDVTVCSRLSREGHQHVEVGANRRAFGGDKYLGGLDFDKALVGLARAQLQRLGVPEADLGRGLPTQPWLWSLLASAEAVKRKLSEEHAYLWQHTVQLGDRSVELQLNVTRADFERVIGRFLDDTIAHCDGALLMNGRGRSILQRSATHDREIIDREVQTLDAVLLVGGSTRVPAVAQRLRRYVLDHGAPDVPVRSYKPDECVAIGAALHAATKAAVPGRSATSSKPPAMRHTVGPEGLAHDLSIRVREGRTVLLRAGATAGAVQEAAFFIGDTSGVVRIPVFEGDTPHRPVEFQVALSHKMRVVLRSSYQPGKLHFELLVDGQRLHQDLSLEPQRLVQDRAALTRQYEELSRDVENTLGRFSPDGPDGQALRREVDILRLDLMTELENPIAFDAARIHDRLRRLDGVNQRMKIFAQTGEGLQIRCSRLLRQFQAHDTEHALQATLESLLAAHPETADPVRLKALWHQFESDVLRLMKATYPVRNEIDEVVVDDLVRELRKQIEFLRKHVSDGARRDQLDLMEQVVDRYARGPEPPADRLAHLIAVSDSQLEQLYRETADSVLKRGLLSLS